MYLTSKMFLLNYSTIIMKVTVKNKLCIKTLKMNALSTIVIVTCLFQRPNKRRGHIEIMYINHSSHITSLKIFRKLKKEKWMLCQPLLGISMHKIYTVKNCNLTIDWLTIAKF